MACGIQFLEFLDPQYVGRIKRTSLIIAKGKWHATSKENIKVKLRAAYCEHYDAIRAVTPPDRLLEYKLGSGWEPLRKFLGKLIPDEPFPHINEKAALKEWIAIVTRRSLLNAATNVVIVSGTLSVAIAGLYGNFI